MNILIIGGTVFMGPHVVRQLVELGHKVTVFHRGNSEPDFPPGVNRIYGDRNQLDLHVATFEHIKPDVVVDMVCFTEAQAVQLAQALGPIAGRIVLASSIDVYAAYGGLVGIEQPAPAVVPLTEKSPLRSVKHPYRGTVPRNADDPQRWLDDYDKIPCEQVVLGLPDNAGVIIRLPMVFGPADRQQRLLPLLQRMDDGRPAIILDSKTAQMKLARGFSENMAWALALAATHPAGAGQVYNAALADPCTELEWLRLVAEAAGWQGKIVTPEPEQLPDKLRPAHDPAYNLYVNTEKIRRELGFVEQTGLPDSLQRTIAWQRGRLAESPQPEIPDYKAEDLVLKALETA